MKIYVVIGSDGWHDDGHNWMVKAYRVLEIAEAHAAAANAEAKKAYEAGTRIRGSKYRRGDIEWSPMKEFDPENWKPNDIQDWFCRNYVVDEVDLVQ